MRWILKNRIWLVIALLSLLFIPSLVRPPEGDTDTAQYIMASRTIIDQHSYPAIRFPPVFPVMLAPMVYAFGYNLLAMQLLIVALAVVTLYVCYRLIRSLANDSYAILTVVLLGTSPLFLSNVRILSDIPFLFFILLALLFLSRYAQAEKYKTGSLYLGAIFVLLAFFTKAAGLALVIAALGYMAYLTLWRHAPRKQVSGALLLLVVPAALWVSLRGIVDQSYLQPSVAKDMYAPGLGNMDWKELVVSRLVAARDMVYHVAKTAIFGFDLSVLRHLRIVVTLLIVALLVWGYIHRHLRRITAIECFVFLYLAMVVAFAAVETRHYLPIVPLAAYFLIVGLRALFGRVLPQSMGQLAFVGVVTLVLLSNLVFHVREMSRPPDADWVDFKKAARWVADNAASDSIVMSRQPEWVTMLAGREAWPYAYSTDSAEVLEPVTAGRVDYVIVDSFKWTETTQKYLVPAIRSDMGQFERIFQVDETIIYKVKR